MLKTTLLISALFLLTSCPKLPPPRVFLPEYIKTISIEPVRNRTKYNVYEEKLTQKLIDEFLLDRRFTIGTREDSDGILYTEITHYILQPITYGATLEAIEYKQRVLANISLTDAKTGEEIWREENLEEFYVYTAPTLPGGMTEVDALEFIYANLAKKILRRIVEGVSESISIKKVPEKVE